MIVENKYNVKLSEISINNEITNKALLGDFEDIGGIHSNMAGYGLLDIPKNHLSWILLDWKLKVIKRPKYAEKIIVKTWSKNAVKCYAYRDFEVCDEKGNIMAQAISKWVLVDIEQEKIVRVDNNILESYNPELNKTVFENENFEKINEPQNYMSETQYKVKRADIDVNNHMHNLNYVDLANEALPEEVYREKHFDNLRISYKKEIKLEETVKCKYAYENNKHIVAIKSEDDKILHAIIEMW